MCARTEEWCQQIREDILTSEQRQLGEEGRGGSFGRTALMLIGDRRVQKAVYKKCVHEQVAVECVHEQVAVVCCRKDGGDSIYLLKRHV